MTSDDLDNFRAFVASEPFGETYDIPDEELKQILVGDKELMLFAFRFLRQTMFGEDTIKMKPDAFDKRLARKQEREAKAQNFDVPTGGE